MVIRDVETDLFPVIEGSSHLFMAYSPLLEGMTEGLVSSQQQTIQSLKAKYNCSLPQLFLAWLNTKNLVSIVRTSSEKHLEENIEATNIEISQDDLKKFENCYTIKKQLIPIDKIQLDSRSYVTLDEALKNDRDLIPSPELLSKRIDVGYKIPPLRVAKTASGYKLMNKSYVNEVKKYWAYRINNNRKGMIEAYIFNDL